MVGHIKLDRKILNWEWYQDANTSRLFIHLLLIANYKNGRWMGNEVLRGQLITGLKELSQQTGLTIMQVRTCFDKLKLTREITVKVTNKFRVVTICKYDIYQSFNNEDNNQINNQISSQVTNKQQTDNKQITTNNNNNNSNKETLNIGEAIKKFNSMPVGSEFNGLPDTYIEKSIELVRITKQTDITKQIVIGMWEIFKVQKLTGSQHYANEGKIYSHFVDWIKFQKFETVKKEYAPPIKKEKETDFDKYKSKV